MRQHKPPGRIHGRVLRTDDGTPVTRASVRVRDEFVTVDLQTTNSRGQFTSRLLFAGMYTVEAESDGKTGAVDKVEVVLGQTTDVTITIG